MSRRAWIAGFLGVTAVALIAELWASFDSSADTTPWTDLIVRYVPGEVTAAVIGALIVWVPVHFAIRYARKRRFRNSYETSDRADDDRNRPPNEYS